MPLTIRSIGDNDIFRALLSALVETEVVNEHIDEHQEKARFDAQQQAITASWDALIALVDAHMTQMLADTLRPDPDPNAQADALDSGDDGDYDLRELYRLPPNMRREDEQPPQAA